jgi:hypothetical protein
VVIIIGVRLPGHLYSIQDSCHGLRVKFAPFLRLLWSRPTRPMELATKDSIGLEA